MREFFQMKGLRGRRHVEQRRDPSDRHAVRPGLHERTKDREAGFMRERRECGNGFVGFHISVIIEIWKPGKRRRYGASPGPFCPSIHKRRNARRSAPDQPRVAR